MKALWIPLSLALVATPAPLLQAATPTAEDEKKKSTDDDLDELIGPVYAETLVVTASRNEISILEAPVSVTVIGGRQLETSPADNYADLLRGVPGLNVSQVSARDINMKSRGSTSTLETGQLALIDGKSVYQDFFGFVMWDLLPMSFDEIKQIEVLRGPGSAVWGANALNGVINVRTKTPRELAGGLVTLTAGEQGSRGATIRWAEAFDRMSYKVSGGYYEQDAWPRNDTLPNGEEFPTTVDFVNRGTAQPKADFRIDFEPSDGKVWSFRASGARTSGVMHTGLGPFQVDNGTTAKSLEVRYESPFVDFKVYSNLLDGDAINLLNGINFVFDTELYVADVAFKKALGDKNFLTWGGDFRANMFDLSIAPRDTSRNEYGIFVEDQITFNEHVLLNLGVRLDHFDTIGSTVSPRTSLVIKPTQKQSIRFAFNRAYRSPSLVNNYLETSIAVVGPGTYVVPTPGGPLAYEPPIFADATGNEDLDEETIDAFEIGYTVEIGNRATFTAAIYRNFTEDTIDFFVSDVYRLASGGAPANLPPGWVFPFAPFSLGEDGIPFTADDGVVPSDFSYRNVGKVRDQGLELSLNIDFNRTFSGVFSYAYQDEPSVKLSEEDAGAPFDINLPPEHSFSASTNFIHNNWFGSLSASYTDKATYGDVLNIVGDTDDFWTVNLGIGVKFADDHFEVALNGTNLFDEDVQQHVFGDIIGRRLVATFKARW